MEDNDEGRKTDEPTDRGPSLNPDDAAKKIFDDASEIPSDQRKAFLDANCRDNADLRQTVESLLKAHDEAGAFFANPTSAAPPDDSAAGQVIDRYKLLQRIGEGGFGTVFMAEQEHPVRRRVALKIIKLGMDTKAVIARFEAERQALAMMDHPNIAKVFDAGATDTGRPYFVMELVRGVPITDYCDTNNLPVRERLELFVQVCQAVQHAHQKGIIHRDIKPNNVMVAMADGHPTTKVIDFGIAKATDQRLTEKTLFTEFRQMIGTPQYMSPEQAEMAGIDIDTRSDVYSLGVLLYELLVGSTPFDPNELRSKAYGEMQRIIREVEPPRPSTRLSTLGDGLPSIAAHRRIDPSKLNQILKGELDWIVMRAMEKDRTRRYDTANGLARDIQRYLADEPVEACPPSASYRTRKLIRKHRRSVLTAALIFFVVFTGAGISAWQAVRATRAEDRVIHERDEIRVEKQRADRSADTARNIAQQLRAMLASADPFEGKAANYTVREMLDDFAGNLEGKLTDQPEVEAELQSTIGLAYRHLGDIDKAEKHLTRSLDLRRATFGEQHERFADGLVEYSELLFDRKEWSQAEASLRQALLIYRKRGVTGRPVLGAITRLQTAIVMEPGPKDEAQALGEQGLSIARQSVGIEFPETADLYYRMGSVKLSKEDDLAAVGFYQQALAVSLRTRPSQDVRVGFIDWEMAEALQDQGKYADSLMSALRGLEIFRRAYPANYWTIEAMLGQLASILRSAADSNAIMTSLSIEQLNEVESLYHQVIAATPPLPTASDPAPRDWRRVSDASLGAARGLAELTNIYLKFSRECQKKGDISHAQAARQNATTLVDRLPNELLDRPKLLAVACVPIIFALHDLGRPDDARQLSQRLLDLDLKPPEERFLDDAASELVASSNPATWRSELAVRVAEKAVQLRPRDGNFVRTLGMARYRAGDYAKAIESLQKSVELQHDKQFSWSAFPLAMAHRQLGHQDEAREWYDRAIIWMDKNQPNDNELQRYRSEAEALLGPSANPAPLSEPSTTHSTAP